MKDFSNESFNSQTNETEGLIDWGVIFQTLYDSLFVIVAVTLIALTLGIMYVSKLPSIYIASTNLCIEMPSTYNKVIYKEFSGGADTEDRLTYYGTQLEILKSDNILRQTAQILKLPEHLRITLNQAIQRLKDQINVNVIHGTEIITITVQDNDPFMAAAIANTMAQAYIKLASENSLHVPKELMKMFSYDGKNLSATESLNQLLLSTDESRLTALPTLTQDPILSLLKQNLLDVQDQIAILSSHYTPEHPSIIELRLKEKLLKQQISVRTTHLLDALKSVLEGDFNVNNVTVLETAFPPKLPFSPRRLRIIFMITAVGFIASIAFVIFFSYLHRKIERAEDLKLIPDVAFLGYVPEIQIPKKEKLTMRQYILKQMHLDSQLRDCIHDIRNNVLFSMPKGKNKTILNCSLLPDEGMSIVSCMLAISMASVGEKTLIIDADMRDPSVHLAFGQENTFGFSNCLVEMSSWKSLLRTVEGTPNLSVLCAGSSAPNSTALLSTPQLVKIINEMKEEFDIIIFDAPPLLHIPDAFIMSEKVDGMVFIIKAGSVQVALLEQIKNKINALRINLVGLVINKVNLKRVFKGYYNSSYGNKKK